MDASEAFYSKLLETQKTFGGGSQGYVGFVIENVTLLLEPVEAVEFEAGRYLGFSLEVSDINAFYERLRRDVRFAGPPETQLWGGVMTHVTDSSNNVLSIVEITEDA